MEVGKRQRTRLQLDVGAYGIAKRGGRGGVKLWEQREQNIQDVDDLGLAAQVGEDAYFVRDNAMGVADGWVGGLGQNIVVRIPIPNVTFL